MSMYLGWEHHFYKPMQLQQVFEENRLFLSETLQSVDVKKVLSERSFIFFSIVIQIVEYIEGVFDERATINWSAIEGYPQLVALFLCEMISRPLERYPDKLREASVRLTSNGNLLPLLIRLVFKRTNVFANLQVFRSIELVEAYFDFLQKKGRSSPTLDYKFFYSAVKIVLESEHANVIGRCLAFLYKHYSMFSVAFRRELSLLLLGQFFFKLFLSWSKSVRQIFHHLLVFRINLDCNFTHKQKPPRFDEQQANEIAEKYHRALNITRSALRVRNKDTLHPTNLATLPLHKQMKQRLMEVRFKKRGRKSSGDELH